MKIVGVVAMAAAVVAAADHWAGLEGQEDDQTEGSEGEGVGEKE